MADYKLKSAQFRSERQASWEELEDLLGALEQGGTRSLTGPQLARLPVLYRGAVSSLSVARSVSLDRNLLEYLEHLVGRAYLAVYARPERARGPIVDFFVHAFPSMVRKYSSFLVVSFALMSLGGVAGFFMVLTDNESYYGLVGEEIAQGRNPDSSIEELRAVLFSDEFATGSSENFDETDDRPESGDTSADAGSGSESESEPNLISGPESESESGTGTGTGTGTGSDAESETELQGDVDENPEGDDIEFGDDDESRDLGSTVDSLGFFASFLFSHNAKIAILCFALGFAAGAPTAYLLFYNGVILGAMGAVYHQRGLSWEFWGWILPHGVTEMGAICLCGMAGMAIGHALVFPGRRTRLANLAHRGREVAVIVIGAVLLLFLAALIEGYFRQLVQSTPIRWITAAAIAAFWVYYFGFVGRNRHATP